MSNFFDFFFAFVSKYLVPVCILKMIKVAESTQAASSHSMIGPDFTSGEMSSHVRLSNCPSDDNQLDINVSSSSMISVYGAFPEKTKSNGNHPLRY